jgi:hypothetical protein
MRTGLRPLADKRPISKSRQTGEDKPVVGNDSDSVVAGVVLPMGGPQRFDFLRFRSEPADTSNSSTPVARKSKASAAEC